MGHNKISCPMLIKKNSPAAGYFAISQQFLQKICISTQTITYTYPPFYNHLPITINYNKLYVVMFVYKFNICDVRKTNLSYKHGAKHVHDRILEKNKHNLSIILS